MLKGCIMRRNLLSALLFITIFVVSCKTTSTFVRPEYSGKTIDQASLLIVPLGEGFIIDNPDINDELGIDLSDGYLVSNFSEQFKSYISGNTRFSPVQYAEFTEKPALVSGP